MQAPEKCNAKRPEHMRWVDIQETMGNMNDNKYVPKAWPLAGAKQLSQALQWAL